MDLTWLPDNGGTGHMPPSEEIINFWKCVKGTSTYTHLIEIGFNAGHSAAINLTLFDDISISSFDIGQFDITKSNGKLLEEKFKGRFSLHIKDSKELKPADINHGQVLFIDGSHDYPEVNSDFELFLDSDIRWAVIDDMQNKNVSQVYSKKQSYFIPMFEQKYFAVLPFAKRSKRDPIEATVRFVKKK